MLLHDLKVLYLLKVISDVSIKLCVSCILKEEFPRRLVKLCGRWKTPLLLHTVILPRQRELSSNSYCISYKPLGKPNLTNSFLSETFQKFFVKSFDIQIGSTILFQPSLKVESISHTNLAGCPKLLCTLA